MRSPLTRAHPSQPQFPCSCRLAPGSGFWHCDGYHTRRRSPPAGLATDRGRGSKPRGGTAAWSHPRRRGVPHGLTEGGLLPLAPSRGAAAFPRPSRPASHIHNHPSACPARINLPPIVTPSSEHAGPAVRRICARRTVGTSSVTAHSAPACKHTRSVGLPVLADDSPTAEDHTSVVVARLSDDKSQRYF